MLLLSRCMLKPLHPQPKASISPSKASEKWKSILPLFLFNISLAPFAVVIEPIEFVCLFFNQLQQLPEEKFSGERVKKIHFSPPPNCVYMEYTM